jgi:hypothetical protein
MNSHEPLLREILLQRTRRHFLREGSLALGALWLASQTRAEEPGEISIDPAYPMRPRGSQFPPRARRVIYLHMAGSPSQLELFDYKPELTRLDGKDCPASFVEGKSFAFIQGIPKLLGPVYPFQQYGQSGAWMSDRWKFLPKVADDLCMVKSLVTDQFNHGPAQLMMHSGTANAGAASFGAWTTYGLGSENENLPGFIVLTSGGKNPDAGKSVWGAGYLPSVFQGVQCRSQGEPVLFLSNPQGISRSLRRKTLDALAEINQKTAQEIGDAETVSRIAQYELAFRMQTSAADAFDISKEPAGMLEAYGATPGKESFANNCLLARRLVENGVRFIQLFDWGWDHHGTTKAESLSVGLTNKVNSVDRPITALIKDLKQRGLLEDTLIVWGGEFGRTSMQENRNGLTMAFPGRDHNPGAFTMWLAGGGVKPGTSFGETDDLGYLSVVDKITVHDLHATLLHILGFDHLRLTYLVSGVRQRLTNVTKPGSRVVTQILA